MFDFNNVNVFSTTQGYGPFDDLKSLEDQIEYIAKVSNPEGQEKFSDRKDPGRLTRYLIDHDHWSPLEMVNIVMKIDTTRDIGRQVIRHVSFRYQEFSQRYAEVTTPFVIKDARSQDLKNRQNSNDDMTEKQKLWWMNKQSDLASFTGKLYEDSLKMGIAKEVARVILPEGMTPTTFFMQGTARSWYHYVKLRSANGTQLEHQDLAIKAHAELKVLMPNIFNF